MGSLTPIFKAWLPLLVAAVGVPLASAQTEWSGHWEGAVQVPNGPSQLTLDLAREKGAWAASLGVPEQNASGLVVTDLSIEGDKLKFNAPEIPGVPVFEFTRREGKLVGTLSLRGHSLPLEMQRTGEAKVELPTPSPAVSSQLEGDWDGALALPDGRERPIQVHFHNLPDHTVAATIGSPSQGPATIGLTGVAQNGRELAFSVRIVGGSFKGLLNEEGDRVTGEWTQKPGATPLPCNMKKK
jgi:hypothetical protein